MGIPFLAFLFLWLLGKAAVKTLIAVHSNIRLLCMTDAIIGVLAGYLCGNPLIGGLVGAVAGILDYKFISVKLLKITEQNT